MLELTLIKETVNQVAEAITAALDIETEIVDHKLEIIGGTGRYIKKIGSFEENGDLDSPYFYSDILRTGKEYIFTDIQGLQDDEFYHPVEGEFAEIACPIKMKNEIIGIIGLVAFDQIQQQKITEKKDTLIVFLRRMSDLICSKLIESQSNMKLASLLESMPDGLIATDEKGIIFSCNYSAQLLLGVRSDSIIGTELSAYFGSNVFFSTMDKYKAMVDKEILYDNNGKALRFYFTKIPVPDIGTMYMFKDAKNVARNIQNMISGRNNTTFDDIYGRSLKLNLVKERALQVAGSNSTILLTGESGTGKGLFARAIHNASMRNKNLFVTVNCGAIPDTLIESELFGYDAGAFTGASDTGKIGKFELANNGTIFLDEIGDIPLHLQVKLLDVLQNHRVIRVGGIDEIMVDVRVIAATNKNLPEMIEKKEFRQDLYFRLNVIPLEVPPLRERQDDLDILLTKTLNRLTTSMQKNISGFSNKAKDILLSYSWPGNIRELENCIEYAVNMEKTEKIQAANLPENLRHNSPGASNYNKGTLKERTEKFQLDVINNCLSQTGDTLEGKRKAAEILGISETTLYRKIRMP